METPRRVRVDGTGHASNRWLKWILVEIVQTLKRAPGPVDDQYRSPAPGQGETQGHDSGRAESLLLYLLDVAFRSELRGVARGAGRQSVGGVPESTAG
jgi:hypothetical protein